MKINAISINLTLMLALFLFSLNSISTSSAKGLTPMSPDVARVYDAIYQVGLKNPQKGIELAYLIHDESKRFNIDPKVMIAILVVESNFRQDVVSSTGDISIAQIHIQTWGKEFLRLNRMAIDENKMHNNKAYAISRMAEILSILAGRHHKQKDWYANYHSKTPELKHTYYKKLLVQFKKMKKVDLALNQSSI
jgi:hypothetical protein